jgi:hypothetical protein
MRVWFACFALCLPVSAAQAAEPPAPLVITRVNVLPMTPAGLPVHDATVVIENGRITSIGPDAVNRPPRGARRIDARGRWLLPGFTDMHTHLENDRLMRLWNADRIVPDGTVVLEDITLPYLANGVTQIFNITAMAEAVGQSVEIESGRVLGPHIANAPMIDGSPPMWPIGMLRSAATPEDGRQSVRDAVADGHRFIKVYSKLTLETFTAIVDEARKNEMRVVGHIPQRGQNLTAQFFQPGYDLVAHAEEYAQQTWPPALDAIPRYVEMARDNGTWLTATLTVDERIFEQTLDPSTLTRRPELRHLPPIEYHGLIHDNPYQNGKNGGSADNIKLIVDFNRELVKAFAVAGIPVLTGTDSPVPGIAPGFSLHDEFESLVGAGMTNQQVLEGTTRLPAEWLGTISDRGTIEPGKRADLVLLDASPLDDIRNTRRIAAVIRDGHYLTRRELDGRMRKLAEANGFRE